VPPEALQDEEDWKALGGDVDELRRERDLLWRRKITPQQYAAWRRHSANRLRGFHAYTRTKGPNRRSDR
jgi:hypothetical protein